MSLISRQRSTTRKLIACTHCGHANEVGGRAMSIFCISCHQRVILENFKLRGYHGVTEFSTCGDVVVERNGFVVAPIKVGKLTVKGKVQGDVVARGPVAVGKTGSLRGDIDAPSLLVERGGALSGFVRIHPLDEVKN